MARRDFDALMWVRAVRVLEQAEHLQRQFFRPRSLPRQAWEPPADVFETEESLWVVVALPGVKTEHVAVELHDGVAHITGIRRLPATVADALMHRLEIPHGLFERRIALPCAPCELDRFELVDGCLYLQFRKC